MSQSSPPVVHPPQGRGLRWRLGLLLAASSISACAHAAPATGTYPEYPEQDCRLNNTVDCRPAGGPM